MSSFVIPRSTKDQSPRSIVSRRGTELPVNKIEYVFSSISYATLADPHKWELYMAFCAPALEGLGRET